jgi:hypothetical protein
VGWRDQAALGAGLALLVSPFLHWLRRGPGHTLSGRDMIDTLVAIGNSVPGLSAARLAVVWYLVPAGGAAVWIAIGADRFRRTTALGAAAVALVAVGGFARLAGFGALGPGAAVAGLAAATLLTTQVRR